MLLISALADNIEKTANKYPKKIPIDKLLLETDVPYLAPEPFKGKRNNPTYIKHTGAKLAELLGLTPHDISKVTIANTNKVLNREE